MLNNDRKMKKWQPFNSLINSETIIKELANEKRKIKKPIISEDQKTSNESILLNAFFEHDLVFIEYYDNGDIITIKNYIKKIDSIYNKIYFYNKILYFDQIINVYY